ncbi:3'5'-cyclic nucleotide phosphodiesterase [Nitzschia inconspicua]|uniref:3'5'-cyclic nucleotide phosphodiesterase n=1 Tax=Nitzschia inconspicua TaxID=303405 RepID=A0A9K3PVW1_9STRA|nr:3'5'-cyclic nucleotide phosphodiesterase [Nitzschia inconspicua]
MSSSINGKVPRSASDIVSRPQVQRLIDWNSDVLLRLLKQVVASRIGSGKTTWDGQRVAEPILEQKEDCIVLDEVTDVIDLPGFVFQRKPVDPEKLELPSTVVAQLKEYVAALGLAYHSNPFHCLQHASQVTTALTKLLSRIVVSQLRYVDEWEEENEVDNDDETKEADIANSIAPHLHNHTFGITSDPLAQFTLVLAALIHEVDHCGINNMQLARNSPHDAAMYKNRSIIEQRSVEKAWMKLMEPAFTDLRKCIYSDGAELKRFRQILVNAVLATDIVNPELQNLRMKRWEKTFANKLEITPEDVNRKATIVIEHLMQAADSFHYMQPWIVYEKWCFKLFEEHYLEFKKGTTNEDPSVDWQKKEIEFFDSFVIPLAMELNDCEAFVVNNDEYLKYALKNRQQLATKGHLLIPSFIAKVKEGSSNSGISPSSSKNKPCSPLASPWEERKEAISKQNQRLVAWNTEMLQRMLMAIVAKRNAGAEECVVDIPAIDLEDGKTYHDEIVEIINFPLFNEQTSPDRLDIDAVVLSSNVVSQLRELITLISSRYRDNQFHGFDRASHVCMTARKQFSRMMTTNVTQLNNEGSRPSSLFERTYGISQDPLAQFAVVFAALIHDCDHPGVPASQMVGQNDGDAAMKWKNKSVNEQNALDTAWKMLMQHQFSDLRSAIFGNASEMKRFRQILVNCCLSTYTTTDDEILSMRKSRWDRAFVDGKKDFSHENRNRRATIVLELIMQSSDVFYATQNWHLYQKWSQRHFSEIYKAYQDGMLGRDPCIFWFKNELLFFDEQVIPITKQLNDCHVFSISGDEQLLFALSNRQQWAAKGGNEVASMVARYHGQEIEKVRANRTYRRMSLSAKQA